MINDASSERGDQPEGFWTKTSGKYLDKAGRGGRSMKRMKKHGKKARRGRKSKKG